MKRHVLLLCVSLLISACLPQVHLYSGPQRPASELSILHFNQLSSVINKVEIDGKSIFDSNSVLYLLPGRHRLTLEYTQNFEDAPAITNERWPNEPSSGVGLARAGSCGIEFSSKAGQSLFVNVKPGSDPLLSASVPAKISIEPEGFNRTPIAESICSQHGRKLSVKF